MKRKKLESLFETVIKDIKLAEVRYKENKQASDQTQKTARTSWSGAGDRVYAEGQKELNKKKLETLKDLGNEIEVAIKNPVPNKIEAPCFITVEINGEKTEFFVVENVANIKGRRIISSKSPMGKMLLRKSVSETVTLNIGLNKTKGKILSIQ